MIKSTLKKQLSYYAGSKPAPSLCDRLEFRFRVFDAEECPSASQICISEQPADWQRQKASHQCFWLNGM